MRFFREAFFPAAILTLVFFFLFPSSMLAATPAELTKDLLQMKEEIPRGDGWTIGLYGPDKSSFLTVRDVIQHCLYPSDAEHAQFTRQSASYAKDRGELTALLSDAVSSDKAALVRYREEYLKTSDVENKPSTESRGCDVEMSIWEFPSEEKAERFGVLLQKISMEAATFGNQQTAGVRANMDASTAEQNKRIGESYYYRSGARNFTAAQPRLYGDDHQLTSAGLGEGSFSTRKQQVYVHITSMGRDWKYQGQTKDGTSLGNTWAVTYTRKGRRVLMASEGCAGYEASTRRVANQWADGRQILENFILVDAVPMPIAACRGIVRSAYYKMAHESPANESNFVTIEVLVPKTKYLRERTQTVFGPAFPDFREAVIHGLVQWDTLFDRGYVYNTTIYVRVLRQGKEVKRIRSTVDKDSQYRFSIKVNKKGRLDVQEFREDISCRLLNTREFPSPPIRMTTVNTTPGPDIPLSHAQAKLKKYLSHCPPKQRAIFDKLAYGVAFINDVKHKARFESGTPNLDKYYKNRKTPAGEITNALMVLGELYLSKDPAMGPAKNADDQLKKVRDYLKSKGITTFKSTGNGQSELNISQWLKNIGDADYVIDQVQ